MDQPAVDNKTEFAAHPQLLLDRDGEKLVTIVKASFELLRGDDELELAPPERMRGVRFTDIPWGEPEISSIAYPADLCLRKPGTDVIVVATAHAPAGRAVPSFDARVEVGSLTKSLRIVGTRVWQAGGNGVSKPAPIAQLDVRYEYAWGGCDDSDPAKIVEEPRNPVGRGRVGDPSTLTDKPAPQIEDPADPVTSARRSLTPAGIGAIGRHWEPRRRYAGSYDAAWLETRAPLPPDDQDDRFYLCASPGLTSSSPLVGGERVALLNLLPGGGATSFVLPKVDLEIEFRADGRAPALFRPHLDTVLIDMLAVTDDKPLAIELSWRASVVAPRRMKDTRVVVREKEVK